MSVETCISWLDEKMGITVGPFQRSTTDQRWIGSVYIDTLRLMGDIEPMIGLLRKLADEMEAEAERAKETERATPHDVIGDSSICACGLKDTNPIHVPAEDTAESILAMTPGVEA